MDPEQHNKIRDNQINKTRRVITIVILSILSLFIIAVLFLCGVNALYHGVGILGAVICWTFALGLSVFVIKAIYGLTTGEKKRVHLEESQKRTGTRTPVRIIFVILGIFMLFFGLSSPPPTKNNVTSISGYFDHYQYTTDRAHINAIILTDGRIYNVIKNAVPFSDNSGFEVDKVFADVAKGQPIELVCDKAFLFNPISIGDQVISAKVGDSTLIAYNNGAGTAKRNYYFNTIVGACLIILSMILFYWHYKMYQTI